MEGPGETYPADSWYTATAHALDPFPPLDGDATADVAVVGGGYTGLAALIATHNLELAARMDRVVRLEAGRIV